MNSRRRGIDSDAARRALLQMATAIAEHFGVPLSEVRYARYEFNDGREWTIACGWERQIDGIWREESWLPPAPSTRG